MTASPCRPGDFVWTAFPERERPVRPGPRHIGYIVLMAGDEQGPVLFAAYTSSQPWRGAKPFGVFAFDHASAAAMGQARSFIFDLRRIAALPLTLEWFPDLEQTEHGIVGRAPGGLRAELETATIDLFRCRPEIIERLGPSWRGRSR